jgi:hypothetical protein
VGTAREAIGKSQVRGIHVMGRLNGINRYKHGITRTNLFLDDEGNCYLPGKSGSFVRADWDSELGKLEASLTTLGWTLNTPYDEDFIAKKQHALLERGISPLTIAVDPQERNIH